MSTPRGPVEPTPPPPEAARDRLVAAAIAAFGHKGFHGTTTRDIASGAGMSPAGMYVHHKSKEELLFAISQRGHEQLITDMERAIDPEAAPADQLAALVRAWVAEHAREREVARIVNDELEALSDEHREQIMALRRRIESCARDIVEAGVASGDFSTDEPGLTARAVLSLGMDVARWYRPDRPWTPEHIAEHFTALALRMVGAER